MEYKPTFVDQLDVDYLAHYNPVMDRVIKPWKMEPIRTR